MVVNIVNQLLTKFAAGACEKGFFFGLPTWYKYLPVIDEDSCTPKIQGLNDIWLIAAALLEIILRVTTFIAIGYIIYGGILYMKSQGRPDDATKARQTIIYALIGLLLTVISTVVVSFAAGRFSSAGG